MNPLEYETLACINTHSFSHIFSIQHPNNRKFDKYRNGTHSGDLASVIDNSTESNKTLHTTGSLLRITKPHDHHGESNAKFGHSISEMLRT